MSRIVVSAAALVVVLMAAGGCKKQTPCEQLIEKTCASATKEECANVKVTAAKADDAKNKVCEQILQILPDRSKPVVGCDQLADMVCADRPIEDCLNMRKEAVGADLKKSAVCDRFRQMILDTRKYNQDARSAQAASHEKAPAARLGNAAAQNPKAQAPATVTAPQTAPSAAPAPSTTPVAPAGK